jgi:8-oxo-dGTP diphosphatase
MIQATLCFIFRQGQHQEILLGYKKRGFGKGKYGGFGGKLQNSETLSQAALRELHEEAGLSANLSDLYSLGTLTFIFPYKQSWDQEVHVFTARKWQGIPMESEEMRPQWFDISHIPLEKMWDDTRYWLPHILAGDRIRAVFTMNQDNETVKDYTLQITE